MVIAIALIVLVVATVLFHFLSPWYFTPIASNWTTVDSTVDVKYHGHRVRRGESVPGLLPHSLPAS